MRTLLSLCVVCLYSLALTGCGKEETKTLAVPSTPPPAAEEHDHEHTPSGFPVVVMSDGTKIGLGFDKEFSMFTVEAPNTDTIEKVEVKTVTDGEEKVYEFETQSTPGGTSWIFENEELGAAMLMGDAVERTLVITLKDGAGELTAAVAAFEGH